MGCSRMTLYRRSNKYKNDGILPNETDCGAKMGVPPMIEDNKLALLNSTISKTQGFSENNSQLSEMIVQINESEKEKAGGYGYLNTPSASTVRFYQVLAVNESDDVHLVKDENMKVKDKRRQMASTSLRNLASHIAAVVHTNSIPVPEKMDPAQGYGKRCSPIYKTAKGCHRCSLQTSRTCISAE